MQSTIVVLCAMLFVVWSMPTNEYDVSGYNLERMQQRDDRDDAPLDSRGQTIWPLFPITEEEVTTTSEVTDNPSDNESTPDWMSKALEAGWIQPDQLLDQILTRVDMTTGKLELNALTCTCVDPQLTTYPATIEQESSTSSYPTSTEQESSTSSYPTSTEQESSTSSYPTSTEQESSTSSYPTSTEQESSTSSYPTTTEQEPSTSSYPTSTSYYKNPRHIFNNANNNTEDKENIGFESVGVESATSITEPAYNTDDLAQLRFSATPYQWPTGTTPPSYDTSTTNIYYTSNEYDHDEWIQHTSSSPNYPIENEVTDITPDNDDLYSVRELSTTEISKPEQGSTETPTTEISKPEQNYTETPVSTETRAADIYFAVDSSGSISDEDFNRVMRLIHRVVTANAGTKAYQYGLIQMANNPILDLPLESNAVQFAKDIILTRRIGGILRLSHAISRTSVNGFLPSMGGRPLASHTIIIFTDGEGGDEFELNNVLDRAEASNVNVIPVSLGDSVAQDRMQSLFASRRRSLRFVRDLDEYPIQFSKSANIGQVASKLGALLQQF